MGIQTTHRTPTAPPPIQHAYLEISSSPEPERVDPPPVRLTAKRTLASTLVSPPPASVSVPPSRLRRAVSSSSVSAFATRHGALASASPSKASASGAVSTTSLAQGTPSRAKPKPKPKLKPRPVVPKHPPSTPMKVIELSDSSEEEVEQEVGPQLRVRNMRAMSTRANGKSANGGGKGKGKARAVESDDGEEEDYEQQAGSSKAKKTQAPNGKKSTQNQSFVISSDDDAPPPFVSPLQRQSSRQQPSQPTPEPNPPVNGLDDAPFDDFYATDEDEQVIAATATAPAVVPAPVAVPAPAQPPQTPGTLHAHPPTAQPPVVALPAGEDVIEEGDNGEEETTPRPRRTRAQTRTPAQPTPTPRRSKPVRVSPSVSPSPPPSKLPSSSSSKPVHVPAVRTRSAPEGPPSPVPIASSQPKPRPKPKPVPRPKTRPTPSQSSLRPTPSPSSSRPTRSPSKLPPSKSKAKGTPSPLKRKTPSLVPHERHNIQFLIVDTDDESDDGGFERGLPRREPMPFPLSFDLDEEDGGSSSKTKEPTESERRGKGKGKAKARDVSPKKDVKGKGKARAVSISEDDSVQELAQEPHSPPPPSTARHHHQHQHQHRHSQPTQRPDASTVVDTTERPAPPDANPTQKPSDDPWTYDLDDLDAEQLQAIAIAADADDPFGGHALGRGEEVGKVGGVGRGTGIEGEGEAGKGVGDWEDAGEWRGVEGGGGRDEVDMDEEMARAIAVAAEWDEREGERERERAREREAGNEDPDAMDVDVPAPPALPEDEEDDPFLVPRREVFDISSDGPEPAAFEDAPHAAPPAPITPAENDPPDIPPELFIPADDPTTTAVASVLEMIPDVEPDHLLALVETHLPTYGPNQIVEFLVSHLFENPGYPRVERGKGKGKERAIGASAEGSASAAGKRKAGSSGDDEGGSVAKKVRIDYASAERENVGGPHYRECAVAALQTAFPLIPLPYLRKKLAGLNGLYAPTYLEIKEDEAKVERGEGERMYKLKAGANRGGGAKGKGKEVAGDEVFEEEKRWLEVFLEGGGVEAMEGVEPSSAKADDANVGEDDDDDEELEDDGTFIECGCCFSTYPFDRMSACPDAHLFCRSCLRRYAANELGSQNCSLKCMHTSGCTSLFPESELRRLLPAKLFSLYERIKQQKELKAAGIEGLEECPFCDWACVLEVSKEEDRLFRCGNEEECGVVSCRLCRKREHVPKTCKEAEEDKHLGGRVAIEEAMTRALMRKCPKCDKEFIKSDGCNKMTCPNCRTLSCYVCKQAIAGYDHFHQNDPRNPGGSSANTKCPLWDSVDQRHDQEVKEAYKKALDDYKRDHPNVEVGKDFKIDLPKSPPKQPNALPAGYIDPHALAGGGAGWMGMQWPFAVGAGAGAGWAAAWRAHVPPPVPHHLRVEPHERAVQGVQAAVERAERALQAAVVAQDRAQATERDFQVRLWGAAAGPVDTGMRRRGVPSGHLSAHAIAVLKEQMSTASVNRRAAEFRFENAERELERTQQNLAVLREDLQRRRAALEEWRLQQQQQQQQLQAVHEQNAAAERQRMVEDNLRRVRQHQEAQAARVRADMARLEERARARRRQPAKPPAKRKGKKR